ncbi:MAG: 30S ribosome-binding factor RbfA [Nitrospirae bacterium]|nr:30S ribosome-binding factor RbfA [Magnetococcales bacterium]HAT49791.1 30S ribosome-binding factor RbfA [Alphaproteobacteria bacterium]
MGVRSQKVGGQIQREIADMLLRGEIHTAQGEGLLSVTGVAVSGDLQVATVYVTAYGQASPQGIEALKRAAGFIRVQLGKRMPRMRRIPELRFKEDTSLAYGNKIENLLGSLDIPAAGE